MSARLAAPCCAVTIVCSGCSIPQATPAEASARSAAGPFRAAGVERDARSHACRGQRLGDRRDALSDYGDQHA